jgi:hypothetical protein
MMDARAAGCWLALASNQQAAHMQWPPLMHRASS